MLPNLPRPLPEQTLDSLFASVLLSNGLYGDREQISRVFGVSNMNFSGTLKGGVGIFYEKLGISTEISANEFVDSHIVLPLFKPFMSTERYNLVQKKILSARSPGVAQLLGIIGMPFFKPWHYYCHECMKKDLESVGFAYSRRAHQVMGVVGCTVHGALLGTFDMEDKAFKCVDGLVFPVSDNAQSAPRIMIPNSQEYSAPLRRFDEWVQFILHGKMPNYPIEHRMAVVESKLQSIERVSGVHNSHPARLEFILRNAFGNGFLNNLGWKIYEGPTSYWPAMLLEGQTFSKQPIANILILAALFESPEEFIEKANCIGSVVSRPKNRKFSIRSQSRLGISRELIRDFLSMPSLEEIAKKHGFVLETAERCLYAIPGLVERRKDALFRRLRRRHRRAAEELLQDNSRATRTALMGLHKATYNWLREKDAEWFDKVMPSLRSWTKKSKLAKVGDFSQEDISATRHLSQFVQKTVNDLEATRVSKKILLKQISREMQLLLRKGQLPQTAAYIQMQTEKPNQYESRVMSRISSLIDQGDRIGCHKLATHFIRRNKSRVDLINKVADLLLEVRMPTDAQSTV